MVSRLYSQIFFIFRVGKSNSSISIGICGYDWKQEESKCVVYIHISIITEIIKFVDMFYSIISLRLTHNKLA